MNGRLCEGRFGDRPAITLTNFGVQDESDYDLIEITLDRMEASVGAGQYQQALPQTAENKT